VLGQHFLDGAFSREYSGAFVAHQQTLVFQAVDLFDIDHNLAFIDYVPGSCDGNVLKSVIQARITAASTDKTVI
jgi:hypothetical protein